MPLILNHDLPVYTQLRAQCPEVLAEEGTYTEEQVHSLLLFNLMTDKIGTELQYLRCLGAARQFIRVEFLRQVTYRSQRQNEGYLQRFYLTPKDIYPRKFDAMIITGAPLERITCEDTLYWEEFCKVLDWSKTNVHSLFAGCWGAFASVYREYGVAKTDLPEKLSGIYDLQVFAPDEPLFRGCGDKIPTPLSRATDMDLEAVMNCPELILLASAENGSPVYLKSRDSRRFYVTGHPEYDRDRLAFEYQRDRDKTFEWQTHLPQNYFPGDDPTRTPYEHWIEPSRLLFCNWLDFYVDRKTAINR